MVSHNVGTTARNSANDDDKCSKSRDFKLHMTVRINSRPHSSFPYSRRVLRYMVLREGGSEPRGWDSDRQEPCRKNDCCGGSWGGRSPSGLHRRSRDVGRSFRVVLVRKPASQGAPSCGRAGADHCVKAVLRPEPSGCVGSRCRGRPVCRRGLEHRCGSDGPEVLSANGHIASSGSTTTTVPRAGTSAGPASSAPVGTVSQSGATEPAPARTLRPPRRMPSSPARPHHRAPASLPLLADRGRDGLAHPGAGRHRHRQRPDDHDHDADRTTATPPSTTTTIPVSSAWRRRPGRWKRQHGQERDRWQRLGLVGNTRLAPATPARRATLGGGSGTGRPEARVALGTPVHGQQRKGQRSWWKRARRRRLVHSPLGVLRHALPLNEMAGRCRRGSLRGTHGGLVQAGKHACAGALASGRKRGQP